MRFDFEWDARKESKNRVKHGVTFAEACTAFSDPLGRVIPDVRHATTEERFILFGQSQMEKLLAVMFVERAPDKVRIFSARPATRRERNQYEQENQ